MENIIRLSQQEIVQAVIEYVAKVSGQKKSCTYRVQFDQDDKTNELFADVQKTRE